MRNGKRRRGALGRAYRRRSQHVLRKHQALDLDDEEVDQLLEVLERGLEELAVDDEVAAGAERRREALVEHELADTLGDRGHAQDHVQDLEAPPEERKVAEREDVGDAGAEGEGRHARVLPLRLVSEGFVERTERDSYAEEGVEERVVVYPEVSVLGFAHLFRRLTRQRLLGSGRRLWRLSRIGEIAKLGRSLRMLLLGHVRDRSFSTSA